MSLAITADPVPLRLDNHGVVRVGQTRVTLDTVVFCHNRGDDPARIADQYPALTPAEIYGTIAYYLQHRQEVDAYLAERQKLADEVHREIEARDDQAGIRERLLARKHSG